MPGKPANGSVLGSWAVSSFEVSSVLVLTANRIVSTQLPVCLFLHFQQDTALELRKKPQVLVPAWPVPEWFSLKQSFHISHFGFSISQTETKGPVSCRPSPSWFLVVLHCKSLDCHWRGAHTLPNRIRPWSWVFHRSLNNHGPYAGVNEVLCRWQQRQDFTWKSQSRDTPQLVKIQKCFEIVYCQSEQSCPQW